MFWGLERNQRRLSVAWPCSLCLTPPVRQVSGCSWVGWPLPFPMQALLSPFYLCPALPLPHPANPFEVSFSH